MRAIRFVILASCLLLAHLASAEINMGQAIDKAGQQRMLSQRIAQSFLLIGIQPESSRGPKILIRSELAFEDNLSHLQKFDAAASINQDLDKVVGAWKAYQQLIHRPSTRENAVLVLAGSDELLMLTHAYVVKLEGLSGSSTGELINIAGRQRMLSQRMGKNFLAKHWGVSGSLSGETLYEDMAEYENILGYLRASEVNTPALNTQLDKVKGQFSYASRGLDGAMSLSGKRLVYVVTGTTDLMLVGMNRVTGLYARLLTQ